MTKGTFALAFGAGMAFGLFVASFIFEYTVEEKEHAKLDPAFGLTVESPGPICDHLHCCPSMDLPPCKNGELSPGGGK